MQADPADRLEPSVPRRTRVLVMVAMGWACEGGGNGCGCTLESSAERDRAGWFIERLAAQPRAAEQLSRP